VDHGIIIIIIIILLIFLLTVRSLYHNNLQGNLAGTPRQSIDNKATAAATATATAGDHNTWLDSDSDLYTTQHQLSILYDIVDQQLLLEASHIAPTDHFSVNHWRADRSDMDYLHCINKIKNLFAHTGELSRHWCQ
jgi:hypothetical protein